MVIIIDNHVRQLWLIMMDDSFPKRYAARHMSAAILERMI